MASSSITLNGKCVTVCKKVKCTLVQALRLCTGCTVHRGSRSIALLFHDHGTRRGWGVSVTPRPLFTPGRDPVSIVLETGWAPGPVWTGAENLTPTGIRSLDRPARSQSLYRLSYPAHNNNNALYKLPFGLHARHISQLSCSDITRTIYDTESYKLLTSIWMGTAIFSANTI